MPPPTTPLPAAPSLWAEVMAHFGLSQAALGRILGLRPALMNHVLTGRRSLPLAAAPAFTRLVLALAPAAPAAPPIPDPAPAARPDPAHPLAQHARACVAKAAGLAVELAAARAKAAWAGRRLAALPQLAAPLRPADAAPPAWLVQFESEARVALAACGPVPQARLALRRAGLLHEAAGAQRLILLGEQDYLVDERLAATFSGIFNPLPTLPLMSFSVVRFTTKAQCQAYLDRKAPERTLLAAHLGTVQAALTTWDAAGDPTADLATAQDMITNLTPVLAATTDPREKLRLERLLNSYRSRATNLGGRVESHGADELLDREQDHDSTTGDLAVLDALIAAVTTRRDALPS